ncbi:MAG TPA: oxaloacetate decarboxylase [Candidatus Tectomicrobia bacterium]|nr:oxaloacetate decarboxylase [Candidatus Tectomicrobia bacterium]
MKATATLRQLLREPGIIVAPGAYDCLTAKLIEQERFPAVYMTGAGTALTRLGKPDLGFATLSEMVSNAAALAATVSIPLIADADTGYGGALNVYRTVRQYEKAGVAGLHIEDQVFPKRCGHLDGKQVVPTEEMVSRLRAAVEARTDDDLVLIARTDALAVTGLDDTLRRCHAYAEAGADVLFIEAVRHREEIVRMVREVNLPLLYNFVEHGKSPLLSVPELERLGFKMVIFPASIMLALLPLVGEILSEIKQHGTTERFLNRMTNVVELFETMGLSDMLALDARVAGGAMAPRVTDARL